MNLEKLIRNYLKKARLLQVATCQDDQPWVCTVYFAFDEDLNLYWLSKPETRHSQELKENSQVAGTIVLPHQAGDEVRGLQLQGTAQELIQPDEARIGVQVYADRFDLEPERVKAILDQTDGHLCYRIKPSFFVLFDTKNFPDNPRQEWRL